jgi:hypothetical protein
MTTDHEKSEKKGGLDSVKKWLGLVAAILSLGTAIWALLHAQADKNARQAEATSLLASGRLQEKAGDYEHAWDSYMKANKIASADGVLSRLVGGATQQQQEAHDALEKVAETWVRDARASNEEGLASIADNAIKVLSANVDGATGAHKADMLAHIGFAYFLKSRYEASDKPATFYREALAVDPQNPYANAFWGHLILFNHGSLADAKQHFAAALASGKEHAIVRQFQLSALHNVQSDEVSAAWLAVVDEMRKAGEPVSEGVMHDVASIYYFATRNEDQRKALYAALPAAEQAELARALIKSGGGGNGPLPVKVFLAESLEAAGKNDEALITWKDVQTAGDSSSYTSMAQDAVKRLGGGKTKRR